LRWPGAVAAADARQGAGPRAQRGAAPEGSCPGAANVARSLLGDGSVEDGQLARSTRVAARWRTSIHRLAGEPAGGRPGRKVSLLPARRGARLLGPGRPDSHAGAALALHGPGRLASPPSRRRILTAHRAFRVRRR